VFVDICGRLGGWCGVFVEKSRGVFLLGAWNEDCGGILILASKGFGERHEV
jgi:hypothetical protein